MLNLVCQKGNPKPGVFVCYLRGEGKKKSKKEKKRYKGGECASALVDLVFILACLARDCKPKDSISLVFVSPAQLFLVL
jgi:hypothetical protein